MQFFTIKPPKNSSKLKDFLPKLKDFLLNSRISLLNSRFRKFCCACCRKIGEKKPGLDIPKKSHSLPKVETDEADCWA